MGLSMYYWVWRAERRMTGQRGRERRAAEAAVRLAARRVLQRIAGADKSAHVVQHFGYDYPLLIQGKYPWGFMKHPTVVSTPEVHQYALDGVLCALEYMQNETRLRDKNSGGEDASGPVLGSSREED